MAVQAGRQSGYTGIIPGEGILVTVLTTQPIVNMDLMVEREGLFRYMGVETKELKSFYIGLSPYP